MSKKKDAKTTIFDQTSQSVNHQVNIAGGNDQINNIKMGGDSTKLFAEVLKFVAASDLSNFQKVKTEEKIKNIKEEVAKGEDANESLVKTLLKATVEQIPAIATVLLTAILNPAAGASAGVKMIAEQILKIA